MKYQVQQPGYAWWKIREDFLFGRLDLFVRAIIDDMRLKGGKSIKDLPQNLVHFCFATVRNVTFGGCENLAGKADQSFSVKFPHRRL